MRLSNFIIIGALLCFFLLSADLCAQNIYELRQYSDQDWLGLSTEERSRALNISNNRTRNQTLV